jgi:hypothetical protein
VVALLAGLALSPWAHPLAFRPLPGWSTGASGTVKSAYVGHGHQVSVPKESAAWIARDVRYRSRATEDPPNETLRHLPRNGIVIWAVIIQGGQEKQKRVRLTLSRAKHFACCEGEYVAGGLYELDGAGPCDAYSVIVRVYFGTWTITRALRAQAQRALDRLDLPLPT